MSERKSQQFTAESHDQDPELSQDMGIIVATFWGPDGLRVDIDTRSGVSSDWLFEDEEAVK